MIGEVDVCTPYSLFSLSIILRRAVNAGRNQTMPNNTQLLTNAEIADRLSTLAQLLSMEKANPYKIKAYRRAANTIRGLGESVDELVRANADLTVYSGIGEAISSAVREIVLMGILASLEKLRSNASPELLSISTYPRLDPKRVLRTCTRPRSEGYRIYAQGAKK